MDGSAAQTTTAPRRRGRAAASGSSCAIESIAQGGAGVGRRTAMSCSSRAAFPGDRVRAEVTKSKRALRPCARGRGARAEPGPGPDPLRPRGRRMPGLARGRPCATSASWSTSSGWSSEALRRLGGLEGFELEPIVAGRRPLALPQQARVLLRRARGRRARAGLPRPRQLGRGSTTRATACSPPSATTPPATWSATGARAEGLSRLRPPRPAPASCGTSSCARAAAPATCSCASSPARATSAPRRSRGGRERSRRRGVLWTRIDGARRGDRRAATRRSLAGARAASRRSSAACASASPPRRSSRPTPRWPSTSTGWRPITPR